MSVPDSRSLADTRWIRAARSAVSKVQLHPSQLFVNPIYMSFRWCIAFGSTRRMSFRWCIAFGSTRRSGWAVLTDQFGMQSQSSLKSHHDSVIRCRVSSLIGSRHSPKSLDLLVTGDGLAPQMPIPPVSSAKDPKRVCVRMVKSMNFRDICHKCWRWMLGPF